MPVHRKHFHTQHYIAEYLIEESQHQMRIDQLVLNYMPSFSREAIKKKIINGEIELLKRPGKLKSSTRVHHNDIVRVTIHKTVHEDEYWHGSKIELELNPPILFEDDNIIIISKPAFMSTHPTGKHLFNCATVFFEARDKKTIHSIHRIDRETSGVLVLGKNPKSTQALVDSFEKHLVKKCYFFISKHINTPPCQEEEFFVDHRLGAKEEGLKRVYINHWPKDSKHGKSAYTDFKILFQNKQYSLGLAFPKSGRQHQIRVHAMIKGLPLLGDKLYLGSFEMFQRFKDNYAGPEDHELMEIPRHALHAIAIKFPYMEKEHTLISEIPSDLKSWINKNININLNELKQQIEDNIKNYFNEHK